MTEIFFFFFAKAWLKLERVNSYTNRLSFYCIYYFVWVPAFGVLCLPLFWIGLERAALSTQKRVLLFLGSNSGLPIYLQRWLDAIFFLFGQTNKITKGSYTSVFHFINLYHPCNNSAYFSRKKMILLSWCFVTLKHFGP